MKPDRRRKPAGHGGLPENQFDGSNYIQEHIAASPNFQGRRSSGSWLSISAGLAVGIASIGRRGRLWWSIA